MYHLVLESLSVEDSLHLECNLEISKEYNLINSRLEKICTFHLEMIQRWRVRSNRKSSLSWHEYTAFCGYINTCSPAIRSMTGCFGVLLGSLKPLYCVLRSVSVSAVLVGSLKPETPLYCVLCSQTPNNYLLTSELFSSIQNFPTFWLEHQLKTFNLLNFWKASILCLSRSS